MDIPWSTVITVAAVSVVMGLLFHSLSKRTENEKKNAVIPLLPSTFGLAVWIKLLYSSMLALSGIGAVLIIILVNEEASRNVLLFFPALFGLISGLGLVFDTKRKVIITEDSVTYSGIFKQFSVPLHRILWIYTSNGMIVIDTGDPPKKVIPMMFEGNGTILKILELSAHTRAQQVALRNPDKPVS